MSRPLAPGNEAALSLSPELAAALERVASSSVLLVALDFDGTLAPLVDRPEDARALPDARAAVGALVQLPRTPVALISGRAMESLLHVADPPDAVFLSGSHGVETRLGGPVEVTLIEQEKRDLATIRAILEGVVARHPGTRLEVKPAGFALHDRGVPTDIAAAAQADAHSRIVSALPSVTERHGSHVLEFSVRSTTKGDAVRMLRAHARATAVVFVGDDVTDEDAFRELGQGDLAVKCGPGETVAPHRVADPPQVAALLARLAAIRARNMPKTESAPVQPR